MKYTIAFLLVAFWGLFAALYLGVEDGSSGLGPLGWIAVFFYAPGGLLFGLVRSTYTMPELPIIWALSWGSYLLLAFLVVFFFSIFLGLFRATPSRPPREADSGSEPNDR